MSRIPLSMEKRLVIDALRTLAAAGATYCIVEKDGTYHGDPEAVQPRRTRTTPDLPNNRAYLERHLVGLKPNLIVEIAPQDGDTLEHLAGNASSTARRLFGQGNYRTGLNTARTAVQVVRFADRASVTPITQQRPRKRGAA